MVNGSCALSCRGKEQWHRVASAAIAHPLVFATNASLTVCEMIADPLHSSLSNLPTHFPDRPAVPNVYDTPRGIRAG